MSWWILSEGRVDGLALGCVAVLLATITSYVLVPAGKRCVSPVGLLRFIAFFILNSWRGGLQVAAQALRGPAALRPALLEVPLRRPENGDAILLVNALSLLPGTLSVELEKGTLCLHVLDERMPFLADLHALESSISQLYGKPA
ncbi:MAG TPA: Na+/H+ antiporter subunit E [Accumulibacter sp.]|nr:Na+/H+ antiporter subunit E [Accumulibacter sp.]